MGKDIIIKKLKENQNILQEYGIKHISLFGSYAKNENTKDSDIDLLYEQNPKKQLGLKFFNIIDILGNMLGKPVDLVEKKSLNFRIKNEILSHKIDII